MPQSNVAFIGLGVMGAPIAGHLSRAGHALTVFNRSAAKTERWCARHRGRAVVSSGEAAAAADFVFSCVGDDDDLRAVALSPGGAFAAMRPGSLFIDHSTTSAAVARELAEAARARELEFIDAPVSGGQAGAEQGILTIMCGGWRRGISTR